MSCKDLDVRRKTIQWRRRPGDAVEWSCLLGRHRVSRWHVSDFGPRGQSCLHAPSTCCGPDVCDIRTSYVSRQCTSSDGDNVAPCLLRRPATPDWLLLAF
ncbi:hypothetical protein Tco_0909513 [Tanacetum coccineum]|uniref:Uncharacterized protein n=1 Tax=Tanacetum coccineum TaxID=301880 RepID=A0ABQ5CSD4_9ASTR